jgi:hypothetical protein
MSGSLPAVGIVHAPGAVAGLRDIVTAARDLCEPVVIFREEVARTNPDLVAAARAVARVVQLADRPGVADVAALRLDSCTTFHDTELEAADAIQRRLELPCAPVPARPWDKHAQRELFRREGLSALRSVPVNSVAEFHRAVAEIRRPGVLKPRRGMASTGVMFIVGSVDVEAESRRRLDWNDLVYEQFIPRGSHPSGVSWLADYVSVETVTVGSVHHHVAVFDKLPISVSDHPDSPPSVIIRETGDVYPSRLTPSMLRLVLDLTSQALDALGIRWRASHTELRVDSDRAEVIEVNGRLGGEVNRLLRLAGGPDVVRAALSVAVGREPDLTTVPADTIVAAVYPPFPQRTGLVRSDVSRAGLRRIPGVVGVDEVARQGDPQAQTGYRLVNLSLRTGTADELDRAMAALLDELAAGFADDGLGDDPWLSGLRRMVHRREVDYR